MKWANILAEEREAFIHFDEPSQKAIVFVRNNTIGNRIKKKVGEPSKIETIKGRIFSMQWDIPYSDRKTIKKALSINNFITTYKSNKEQIDENQEINQSENQERKK